MRKPFIYHVECISKDDIKNMPLKSFISLTHSVSQLIFDRKMHFFTLLLLHIIKMFSCMRLFMLWNIFFFFSLFSSGYGGKKLKTKQENHNDDVNVMSIHTQFFKLNSEMFNFLSEHLSEHISICQLTLCSAL